MMHRFFYRSFAILACVLLLTAVGFGQTKSKSEPSKAPAASKADKAPAKAAKAAPIDLNSATKEQLATLPGIGDVKAQAIIAGRPYAKKDQLVSKKILTQDAYDKISALVVAKQSAATKEKAPAKSTDKAKTKLR